MAEHGLDRRNRQTSRGQSGGRDVPQVVRPSPIDDTSDGTGFAIVVAPPAPWYRATTVPVLACDGHGEDQAVVTGRNSARCAASMSVT
jgi:hypothetical protein